MTVIKMILAKMTADDITVGQITVSINGPNKLERFFQGGLSNLV